MQAFIPTPASKSALVGKAAVIVASTLALAVHALWARPFAPAQAWKGTVRAALLVLAAASAAVVAWAGALDLRIVSGTGASRTLTAGSYVLVVLFAAAITLLVAGVATAMLRGARESAGTRRMQESATLCVNIPPLSNAEQVPDSVRSAFAVCATAPDGSATTRLSSAAETAAAIVDSSGSTNADFASVPVRRRKPSVKRRQRGESRRWPNIPPLLEPSVASTSAILADMAASDADVVAACDGIASSLQGLSAAEARGTSALLLPGLSARFEAALSGGAAFDSTAVEALCRAMAALSDHADAALISRLAKGSALAHLAALLRQCVSSSLDQHTPPVLSPALWLLGNLAADRRAVTTFVAASGAELLVSFLSASRADLRLHICVAVASLAARADAALALLRAGVIPALACCLSEEESDETYPTSVVLSSDPSSGACIADAEAACRALASVLQHCAKVSDDATHANSELVASRAIEGCTAALRRAAASPPESLPVEYAARAAEALLGIMECDAAAAGGGGRSGVSRAGC